ncbi:MAG TPA: FHA domain-containing protein [Clostridiaceae bacterium]|nr:FHA domain-containing protein [Clostridiaceae bacterium]
MDGIKDWNVLFSTLDIVEIRQNNFLCFDIPPDVPLFHAGIKWLNSYGRQYGLLTSTLTEYPHKNRLAYPTSGLQTLADWSDREAVRTDQEEQIRRDIDQTIKSINNNGYIDSGYILLLEKYIFITSNHAVRLIFLPLKPECPGDQFLQTSNPNSSACSDEEQFYCPISLQETASETETTLLRSEEAIQAQISFVPLKFSGCSITPHTLPFVIGKSAQCDAPISDNPAISRRHCLIDKSQIGQDPFKYEPVRGMYRIKDLGSLNGTFVNNSRLQPGRFYPLAAGDLLRLADYNFRVHIDTAAVDVLENPPLAK